MKFLKLLLLIVLPLSLHAKTYTDSIVQFRHHYKEEFLQDDNSPLKASDTAYLRFYSPDITYRVKATFIATPEAKKFSMPTHSGTDKEFRQYGIVHFSLHDTTLTLHIYQSLALMNNPKLKDYLFIPFTDFTNYDETFGGGRYLDLSIKDIQNNEVILDFNKCYNPYCAYAEGYSCPIPPHENDLHVAIRAGEKLYAKQVK